MIYPVSKLISYLEQHIHKCRRVEANLGPFADDTYLAVAERNICENALSVLGHPIPPRDEEDLRYRGTAAAMMRPRRKQGRKTA